MRNKRKERFVEIEEIKARWQNRPTELLKKTLSHHALGKAGAIAIREILEERGELEPPRGEINNGNAN